MADGPKYDDKVPVGRIFLGLTNPRHEAAETEAQAISRLCDKEQVYPLARDIAKMGLNPLDRFGLIPLKTRKGKGDTQNYYTSEGNRRLCALKLLNDPELAPAPLRDAFERLAENWTPLRVISAAIFEDAESARPWLERTHNGPQGGIGRKPWSSDQKQRFDGGNKNRLALALLDYALAENMISEDEREGKLTTVQRFAGNPVFQEALGLDPAELDSVGRTRPKKDFDTLLRCFTRDLLSGKNVNSRKDKEEVVRYARNLSATPGLSGERTETETLEFGAATKPVRGARRKKPKKPEKARHVRYEDAVFVALRSLGNDKLSSLYHSICDIPLEEHTPLIAVGVWAFFETLTACAGKNPNTSFDAFLSNNKLRTYGITGELQSFRDAMKRISAYGNTTKHHAVAATFNGDQVNNDMITLRDVILMCIDEASRHP